MNEYPFENIDQIIGYVVHSIPLRIRGAEWGERVLVSYDDIKEEKWARLVGTFHRVLNKKRHSPAQLEAFRRWHLVHRDSDEHEKMNIYELAREFGVHWRTLYRWFDKIRLELEQECANRGYLPQPDKHLRLN